MSQFYYPDTLVQIEFCTNCRGFWLDADEIKEIRNVLRYSKKMGKRSDRMNIVTGSVIKKRLIAVVGRVVGAMRA
ncbi:zf-TFIIB domain-containing protein [Planctomycetota bacterium]|nr:zf-TFIIB domain-containing protein [Planctomycetota bacterium]